MADNKDRKIFSLQQFRGLDKENKPLKVAPFRATDGYNFIIDSNVLKTRPAFKIDEQLPFVLISQETLLDWYEYANIKVYVTNKRILFNSTAKLTQQNFDNKRPMFFEEKDVLFIFGLNTIYVVGIHNAVYVIYALNNKPVEYVSLPDPYIPTLFIGNDPFEDINLLSNKTKYRIFAATSETSDGNQNIYFLPTVYDQVKNGTYSESVRFYNGLYEERVVKDVFPVFLGIDGIDFEYTSQAYGATILSDIQITDTIYPTRDFEFFEGTPPVPIYNQVNISKNDFFKLYINSVKQTAFEYAMLYIDSSMANATENKVITFKVPVKYNAIYRDATENFIKLVTKEETEVTIYVQLKKIENIDYSFLFTCGLSNVVTGQSTGSQNNPNNYPEYPSVGSPFIHEFNLGTSQAFLTGEELLNVFRQQSLNYISTLKETCSNNSYSTESTCELNGGQWRYQELDTIKIIGRYFVFITTGVVTVNLYSFAARYDVKKDTLLIVNDLYNIEFNQKQNAFELRIKDFLYDYKNEPSIEVTFTFQNNPDYNYINHSTFGTLFGSENRLFLAGHQDFPNIDRYNVSNDLLGDNVLSQSYELTYFPSKNYRVVGGKGKINGYAVATDTSLYISKEEYPGDSKLFIRTRSLSEQGVVGYFEYKTSVSKTPLNPRCFVRFYNDILMLSKDGLYAVELSENVLTSERLLKLRSCFINKDLKQSIANFDNEKIFIAENNYYMYIFIDDVVYVADPRYTDTNPNSVIENMSYEIVKWNMNTSYKLAKLTETKAYLLDDTYSQIYTLVLDESQDDNIERTENQLLVVTDAGHVTNPFTYFITDSSYDTKILQYKKDVQFIFTSGFQYLASETTHYTVSSTTLTVVNIDIFRDITDGDTIYYGTNNTLSFVVSGFESSNRTIMTVPSGLSGIITRSIANTPLYIVEILTHNNDTFYRFDRYKPDAIVETTTVNTSLTYQFYNLSTTCNINYPYPIQMMWLSNINDFGNNFMEKTMFRVNLYATKQDQENILNFGYKTMRRLKELEDSNAVVVPIMIPDKIDLSNNFNFDELSFNIFSINTFQESGLSLPMKENNFLYIQFMIHGIGNIEFNGFHVVYKNNRTIKSIA
jgi:hypothetical protein